MRVDTRNMSFPEELRYRGDGIEDALESFRSAVNERVRELEQFASA